MINSKRLILEQSVEMISDLVQILNLRDQSKVLSNIYQNRSQRKECKCLSGKLKEKMFGNQR